MPRNKIPKLREPKGVVVQQVRDMFLEEVYKQSPDEFHPEDVRLVENMDFLCQRFVIMQRKQVKQSVDMMTNVLKWRKEKRLHELQPEDFPQELPLCGAVFLYEADRFGNRTLYLRASMCKNCSELKAYTKDFLSYLMFKIDDSQDGTPFSVVMDLTNTSWSNYDLDLLTHYLALLKDYFPVNLDYVLAVNFPWILSTVWSLIKRLIPQERRDVVMFISSDKIFEYIAPENCPDFLGGNCKTPYQYHVKSAPTFVDVLNKDMPKLSRKRVQEILNTFADTIPKEQKDKLQKQIETSDWPAK